jgi:tRNA1Val (adenine37-N6)-methyltransferase
MSYFKFKGFEIEQKAPVFKIGTDTMVLLAYITKSDLTPTRILDIGCGTGVLAIGLATYFSKSIYCAIDIEDKATLLTANNCVRNAIQHRGKVICSSLEDFQSEELYDCIVSNPPYFTNDLKNEDTYKRTARHTDTLSLNLLFRKTADLLSEEGVFWLIYPSSQHENIEQEANSANLFLIREIHIYGKSNNMSRIIYQFGHVKALNRSKESLVIRTKDGAYTIAYKELTKDLHGWELN